MALTISQAGSGNSTTSSATLAVTLTQSFAVGDMVVVCVAADNNGTNGADSISSVTDSKSHTYTLRATQNNDPGAEANGATIDIYTTIVTTAMTTSDVVTANFSPNTASKAMVIWEVAPGAGETPTYISNGGTTNNSSDPALTSSSITSGDAVIYALAAESRAALTGDSDTTRGSWSTLYTSLADTGTGGTSMRVGSQYKVVTGTGTQAWGTTLNSSDWAISYIILHPAVVVSRTATGSGTGTGTSNGYKFIPKSFLHVQYSTNFLGYGAAFYIGPRFAVLSRTATGSGTGTSTATRLIIDLRTATASGTGSSTATRLVTNLRTATSSGTGSSTATRLITDLRTASGSGTGSSTATRLIIDLRTATGSGSGTSTATGVKSKLRTATASGAGTSTTVHSIVVGTVSRTASGSGTGSSASTRVITKLRTATSSGAGTSSAARLIIDLRTATGSGTGSSSVTRLVTRPRTASVAGAGTSSASRVVVRIRTATASGVGSSTAIRLITDLRTATGSGVGSSSATGRNIFSKRTGASSGAGTIDVTRTNLILNPTFEVNTSNWAATGGATLARSTAYQVSGVASALVTSTTTDYNGMALPTRVAVSPSTAYSLSAYCRNISGNTRLIYIGIQWYTSAGVYISELNSGSQGTLSVAAGWVRRTVTGTAPANAASAQIFMLSGTTGLLAGWESAFDAVLFERSPSVLPYFDGAGVAPYTGYTLVSVGWDGTANASTSTSSWRGVVHFRTPRRSATGSGNGASSTTSLRTILRSGTASAGTGSSAVSDVVSNRRTATGSGVGSSTSTRLVIKLRTATSSGAGSAVVLGFRAAAKLADGFGIGDYIPPTWVKSHIFRTPLRNTVKSAERSSPGDGDSLFRYATRRPRGDNLYRLVDGTYTATDPRRPELVVKIYLGGHDNFLSDEEVVELTAAGYGANIT